MFTFSFENMAGVMASIFPLMTNGGRPLLVTIIRKFFFKLVRYFIIL